MAGEVRPDDIDQAALLLKEYVLEVQETQTQILRALNSGPTVMNPFTVALNPGIPSEVLGLDLARHDVHMWASANTVYISDSISSLNFAGTTGGGAPGFLVPSNNSVWNFRYNGKLYAVNTDPTNIAYLYVVTTGFAELV